MKKRICEYCLKAISDTHVCYNTVIDGTAPLGIQVPYTHEVRVGKPIKPATSSEEWRRLISEGLDNSPDLNITVGGMPVHATPEGRHFLAALALYDQPFGFTQYDVTLLRHAAAHAKPAHPELNGLADRIAALLPEKK